MTSTSSPSSSSSSPSMDLALTVLAGAGTGTLLLLSLALLWLLLALIWRRSWRRESGLPCGDRVLLVTAHPDDEVMFFAPTIHGLLASGAEVWLLCLSSGDYRSEGGRRKEELAVAADALGLGRSRVVVIEHSKLPDHPRKAWPKGLVAELVLGWAERLAATAILTFDGGGVSGHSNHIAVFKAIQVLYSTGRLPVDTAVFVLDSVCLPRKYGAFADVAVSLRFSPFVFVGDWAGLRRSWAAMRSGHRSQMVWFRYLYLLFSRYLYLNSLRRMAPVNFVPLPSSAGLHQSQSKTRVRASSRSASPPPQSTNLSSPTRRPLIARAPLI